MTVTGVKLQVESSTKLKIQLRVLLIEDNQLDSERPLPRRCVRIIRMWFWRITTCLHGKGWKPWP
jgi:hypothetical protein